jgi:beta-1,4-N-acetylglucosaminyltransferase
MKRPPSTAKLRAFVTVGSTKFDSLVNKIISSEILDAFYQAGFSYLTIQAGNTDLPLEWAPVDVGVVQRNVKGLDVELWRFKADITGDILAADLIISHAGTEWRLLCTRG